VDPAVAEAAAVRLQAAWRGYRDRRNYLEWRDSAVILQRSWRTCRHRRALAAVVVQCAWRGYRERRRYRRVQAAVTDFQAAGRGYLARLR